MDSQKIKNELEKEGFKHIYEWTDNPNTEYKPHKHKDKVSFYITKGLIILNIGGKEVNLKEGDRFDVPPNTEHIAKVGPNGCSFIVGEMIDGDS